jgi:hypothetical protein
LAGEADGAEERAMSQDSSMMSEPAGALSEYAALGRDALARRLRVGVERFDPRVFHLSGAQLDTAFGPEAGCGRWSARAVIGHLADAELVLTHRMRRIAAEPGCVLSLWDFEGFIEGGFYGSVPMEPGTASADLPIGASVAVIHATRQWNAAWLEQIPEAWLSHEAMHPERGPVTVGLMAAIDVWHIDHHAYYLNRKVARLLG